MSERLIELERADAAREALEQAAKRVESLDGGFTYRKAFKTAAGILRMMKAQYPYGAPGVHDKSPEQRDTSGSSR